MFIQFLTLLIIANKSKLIQFIQEKSLPITHTIITPHLLTKCRGAEGGFTICLPLLFATDIIFEGLCSL